MFRYLGYFSFGGNSEEETPDPIPNSEVKLFSADGTARGTAWESRTSPKDLLKVPLPPGRGAFLFFSFRVKLILLFSQN